MTEPNHFIGRCYQREDDTPHPPHVVDIASCGHEVTTWCYGVPEPGSLEEVIAGLQLGQRVRVVWEGVVDDPHVYPGYQGIVRDPVALKAGKDGSDHLVLRYTGQSPGWGNATARTIAGKHNSGVVSVEMLPDPVDAAVDGRCPTCTSPAPHLHPAMQSEGEVQPCRDSFHDQVTTQNPNPQHWSQTDVSSPAEG